MLRTNCLALAVSGYQDAKRDAELLRLRQERQMLDEQARDARYRRSRLLAPPPGQFLGALLSTPGAGVWPGPWPDSPLTRPQGPQPEQQMDHQARNTATANYDKGAITQSTTERAFDSLRDEQAYTGELLDRLAILLAPVLANLPPEKPLPEGAIHSVPEPPETDLQRLIEERMRRQGEINSALNTLVQRVRL